MKLNESIGRYSVRKVIRFAMIPADNCATEVIGEIIAQEKGRLMNFGRRVKFTEK